MLTQDHLVERLERLSQLKQRPITLKQLYDFGSSPTPEVLLKGARFLHRELPVRLAHRILELDNLPSGLSAMPSVRLVRGMYVESSRELIECPPPETSSAELQFTRLLENIKQRHNNVVSIMATGIMELRRQLGSDALDPGIHEFLDRFYLSRIGIRMLIGQHIALHQSVRPGYVGLICEKLQPRRIVRETAGEARALCLLRFNVAPEVGVYGQKDLSFTYVPSHLHHMLFELLKNSMRAVVEFHGVNRGPLPKIRVVFAEGEEDVTLKTSDEGGGIPRSGISKIWSYLYSTAEPTPFDPSSPYQNDFNAPMAGFGYGLPLSRLYSKYFGGDLQVISMEGYGTDAYLHLRRLGNTEEALP